MKKDATLLRIIDHTDGRWEYDIKNGLSDDDLRKLLDRLKYIETELKARLKTEIVQMTETIEFILEK